MRLVELQNTVQGVDQSGGEIQLMYGLLQDLQSALSSSKQLNEEVQYGWGWSSGVSDPQRVWVHSLPAY